MKYKIHSHETMAFANINENGSREQKVQLDVLKKGEKLKHENFVFAKILLNEVSNGIFVLVRDMLLEPTFDPFNYHLENEKKHKKKRAFTK